MFRVLDLFSGLGMFSRGLEATGGFETVAFCDNNAFSQRVLKFYHPLVPVFGDVAEITQKELHEHALYPNVITAGFPCQPFSIAGKKDGQMDERYLWPEILRITTELRPAYLILENVPNLLNLNGGAEFGIILEDLSKIGYISEWTVVPASAFGAPHERRRLYLVAYPDSFNGETGMGVEQDGQAQVFTENPGLRHELWLQTPDPSPGVDDGFSSRFYADAVSAIGNSLVPCVIEWIGNLILKREERLVLALKSFEVY